MFDFYSFNKNIRNSNQISFSISPKASIESFEPIVCTRNSYDMADVILSSNCSHAITIFEGSPDCEKQQLLIH
jgi:hypothetical protein